MGLILAVVVHGAQIQDRDGAKLVLERIKGLFPRLKLIWADGGYAGSLVEWVKSVTGWVLEIVKRPNEKKGFMLVKRRWVVGRTLACLNHYRRLSKDYEYEIESSEAWVYIAMTHVMVRRLKPPPHPTYGRILKLTPIS